MFSDPVREIVEVAECVSVAGDKIALAVLDVGEGAEAVDLQLENLIVGVEGFGAAGKPYRAEISCEHGMEYSRTFVIVLSYRVLRSGISADP